MTAREFEIVSAQESGISGFLLLFVLMVIVHIATALFKALEYVIALSGNVVTNFARAVALTIGLVLIFRRYCTRRCARTSFRTENRSEHSTRRIASSVGGTSARSSRVRGGRCTGAGQNTSG